MLESKRILILTADAGFGHRSAANAIAEALRETHGQECVIDVVNPLDNKRTPAMLRNSQADYDRWAREMPDLYKFGYEASDATVPSALAERALRVLLYTVMRETVRQYQPDAIVTTYPLYQAPLGTVFAISKRYTPLITVVTDLATVHRLWFSDDADLCLVPTSIVRDLAIEAGLDPDRVQITGIPVHPRITRDTRDRSALRTELGWRNDLTTILAVGSKRVEHMADILHTLNHSGLPIQLAVIAGGDDEAYQRYQKTEWHVATHIYNFVKDMPTMMRAADGIVCKAGGLIVTESLASGLPMMLIDVIPGQETGNAQYVIDGGAGGIAHDPIEALEIMCHWLNQGGQQLADQAANARQLGRPRAAYDIAELAWTAAQRGPQIKTTAQILGFTNLVDLLKRHNVPLEEDQPEPPSS